MQENFNIRNFCIIAHIDHGKSTLADRFLELTSTVEKRKMREQYLDQMDLERERGITIKMQPVRMLWHPKARNSKHEARNKSQAQNSNIQNKDFGFRISDFEFTNSRFILNLIDTPGHIDFSYEVSRSLKAVEGAILLVDATQGVQAQTVSNLEAARELGLTIVPAINKIDSPNARIDEAKKEIANILGCKQEDILEISAKTGEGVKNLLEEVVERVPAPKMTENGHYSLRALVFDFEYSPHKGIVLYIRVMGGVIKKGDGAFLYQANKNFSVAEVGVFKPIAFPVDSLSSGEIGYVVTGLKEANIARVGDTLLLKNSSLKPLEGYEKPTSVVWASVYPESQDDFVPLRRALERLNLMDSALSFEEEESGVLGRGFRCGFLGMLHLEIIAERLKREFSLALIMATPSVVYKIEGSKGGTSEIYSPALFPENYEAKRVLEPWIRTKIITTPENINDVMQILRKHDAVVGETDGFGDNRFVITSEMPLREMMDNFFEEIKSVTSGYASLSYEMIGDKDADLVRLDVLLNEEKVPAFSRVVKRRDVEREAKRTADRLKKFIPRALFVIKIQVKGNGRILAARSISALRKDVTGHLYGGDVTRKMKLLKKQKKGKERLKKFGRVNVPHDVFLKMIRDKD